MATAYVALGSNLGSREAFLRAATSMLRAHPDLSLRAESALYETPPLGPPQPMYLNAAVRIETSLDAHALLAVLQGVERSLLRTREVRFGPRTLDLDLLSFDGLCLEDETLTLPHPRMHERAFVLAPRLDLGEDASLRESLSRLGGPPPRRAPARAVPIDASAPERGFVLASMDAADALALAASEAFPRPAPQTVEHLEVADPLALFSAVAERGGGTTVVTEASSPIRALWLGRPGNPPFAAPRAVVVEGASVRVTF